MAARKALDHSKIILAGVIPDRGDLLDLATNQLTELHFPDLEYRNLFLLLERYVQQTRGILTLQALEDLLSGSGADKGKIEKYKSIYEVAYNSEVSESDFRWSIGCLKELAAERATAEAITSGMEVLNRGIKDKKGKDLFGHSDARTHVLSKFAEIDRNLSMQESPEGDARTEADEILDEYLNPKTTGGIRFGIPQLDEKVGGLQNGELDLIVGYSSSGKTSCATIQLPWSAAIEQGKNVVILTTETLRPQVRRKLLCRHSRLSMFGLEKGIDSRKLKKGIEYLSAQEDKAFRAVVDDFTKNPNYGKLVIVQVPRNSTISTLEGKLLRFQRDFQVDLAVIDYLALLKPDRRFNSRREELAATILEAKQLATTFDDGRGIPVVSPWQTSRDSWKEAQDVGHYNSSALAETAEATSSSDLVITLLEPKNNENREADIKVQIVKHRDGIKSMGIDLTVDYATAYWSGQGNALDDDDLGLGSGTPVFGA